MPIQKLNNVTLAQLIVLKGLIRGKEIPIISVFNKVFDRFPEIAALDRCYINASLKVMCGKGLVTVKKVGGRHLYSITDEGVKTLVSSNEVLQAVVNFNGGAYGYNHERRRWYSVCCRR